MTIDNEKKETPKLPTEEPLEMIIVQNTGKPLKSKKSHPSSKKEEK